MPTYSVNYDLLSDDNHEIRNEFSNFIKKFNKYNSPFWPPHFF